MRRVALFSFVAIALVGIVPTNGAAQALSGQAIRVRWPAANALVYPDTLKGVQLWLAPTMHAVQDGKPAKGELELSFIPDSLESWAVYTRQLLELSAPPIPGDTLPYVSSGVLRDISGGTVIAVRLREGSRLASHVRLLLTSPTAESMLFELERIHVDTLLTALERAASTSRFALAPKWPVMKTSEVRQIWTGHGPRYPEAEKRDGVEGEAWISVVVDTTGRADPSTMNVLFADSPGFVRAIRVYLEGARYVPATEGGRPTVCRVQQRFSFTLTH